MLIALECGVLDVLLLTAIGALTATCMAFGWLGKLVREKEVQHAAPITLSYHPSLFPLLHSIRFSRVGNICLSNGSYEILLTQSKP